MKTIRSLAILAAFLFIAETAMAANYYVRAGAAGANNGADWTNAYTSLPATLVRGASYYVADGSYGSYTFNDPASASSLIIVKKATLSDHGTDTGWDSSYGDGQAIWGRLVFATSYYTFDGATRNNSNWADSTAYGFVVDGGPGGNNSKQYDVSGVSNITIRYSYSFYDNVHTGSDVEENRDHGLYSLSGSNYITLEYSYVKNTSWKAAILINSTSGPITIKSNYFENIYKKELFSARSTHNVTFALNHIKNAAGTGILVADDSDNWNIYGNVFWSPSSSYTFTDVIMGTWTGDHPDRNETLNNWKIYNNTFYQMRGASQIQIQHGSGNVAANNLFIGFSSSINGSITAENNTQNASTSVVTNADGGYFNPNGAISTGTILPAPYNMDPAGIVRGADGVWDRGAFEFSSGVIGARPSPPSNLNIIVP